MILAVLRRLQFGLVFLLLLTAGCVTPIPPEQIASADYGTVPPIYKDAIQGHMQGLLFDPYSAHYRYSADPVKGYAYVSGTLKPPVFGYLVTVGINAKNRMGGYTGEKPYLFLFHNDQFYMLSEYTKVEVVK